VGTWSGAARIGQRYRPCSNIPSMRAPTSTDGDRKIRAANSRSDHATSRVVMTTDEWLVLLPNRCPAYISPEHYERNQGRLQANRARAHAMGAARSGSALLAGMPRVCSLWLSTHRPLRWRWSPSHV
jgi:hypothetical protein